MDDLNNLSKKELIERLNIQEEDSKLDRYSEQEIEMNKLDRLSMKSNPNQLPYRETADHKNVMLYTSINKPIGALHPDNARTTMRRWKNAGIQLYITKRTEAQVEAFKKTPEYIKSKMKHDALRSSRRAQSSKSKNDQMIKDIARVTAEAVAGAKNG